MELEEVVYEINLFKTNEVANNFSSTIASYVKNNCILPAETVYTKLSADWSGSAAETHLFKIFKLKDNYILLNDCLVEIGNEISKVVEKVIHADGISGGIPLPLEIVYKQKYDESKVEKKVVNENVLAITEISKNEIDTLIETIYEIKIIGTKIDAERTNLISFWKVGSGRDKIITALDNLLLNLFTFEMESLSLIDSLTKVKKVLLEETSQVSSSGKSSGGAGSPDNICPKCGQVLGTEKKCPVCGTTI